MRIADYIALADRIKERFDVAALSVGGVAMWPFVRLLLFFAHEHKHLPALQGQLKGEAYRTPIDAMGRDAPRASVDWSSARIGPSAALLDRRTAAARPDILVMQDPNDYLVPTDGSLVEPLRAGLREQFGERYRINGLVSFHPLLAAASERRDPGLLHYAANMRRPLLAEADLARFMRKLGEIARLANAETGEATIVPADALCWMQRMMGFVPAFTEILEHVRPRCLMMQSSLGLEKLALTVAAKRAGITVVDHQHGIFRAESTLYVDWGGSSSGAIDPTPDVFW
ncbi:MAG: hypothetical protein SFW09_17370, partial [Hyphomicrobiaceae bacterium]|nr:hypothetical protein [Hyphomicrobiaceae bacterium]